MAMGRPRRRRRNRERGGRARAGAGDGATGPPSRRAGPRPGGVSPLRTFPRRDSGRSAARIRRDGGGE